MWRCLPVLFAICVALCAGTARANFHLWFIKEIFSSADGSVQFIELFTTSSGQEFLSGHNLTSTTQSFNFTNSPAPTNNRHLLLATAGFAALPGGATPNYTIPSNFFNPAGDTLNFAGGFNVRTFAPAPSDGIMSLNYATSAASAVIAANSPRNFAGAGGSLDLSSSVLAGDSNNDGVVDVFDFDAVSQNFGMTGLPNTGLGLGDANDDGVVDVFDFDAVSQNFGNVAGLAAGAVPEPASCVLVAVAMAMGLGLRRPVRI